MDSKGVNFTTRLMDLQPYMELIELEPGTCLYAQDGGVVEDSQRGVSILLSPLELLVIIFFTILKLYPLSLRHFALGNSALLYRRGTAED